MEGGSNFEFKTDLGEVLGEEGSKDLPVQLYMLKSLSAPHLPRCRTICSSRVPFSKRPPFSTRPPFRTRSPFSKRPVFSTKRPFSSEPSELGQPIFLTSTTNRVRTPFTECSRLRVDTLLAHALAIQDRFTAVVVIHGNDCYFLPPGLYGFKRF